MVRSDRNKLLVITIGILSYQTLATRHFLLDYVPKMNILIDKHLKEENNYPVVHAFVDRKVKNEWSTLILSTYSKQIPIVLFHKDARVYKFSTSNRVKFHYVIGIFEFIEDVDLRRWKEAVGDKWNPRSKFVIWIIGQIYYKSYCKIKSLMKGLRFSNHIRRCYITEMTNDSKRKLFNEFWSIESSANVIIISFNSTSKDFDLSGYDPFYLRHSNKRGIVYPITEGKKMFPEKFMNLYGYPIRISMFQKPPFVELKNYNTEMAGGEDVEFFWLLQSYMNFSIILLSDNSTAANYGVDLPNGESVGLIGDILLNRSEVLGNIRFIHTAFDRDVEFFYPYSSEAYNAIVPYRKPYMDLNIIGKSLFHYETILNVAPVLFLTMYLYFRKEQYPFFSTWNIILNHQFRKISKINFDRIVKFTWIVYVLIISCVFEIRLIDLLTKPFRCNQIETLSDLNNTNLTLMVGDRMLDPIMKSSLPIMQDIAKKTKTNLNYSSCSQRLLHNGDVACASDKMSSLLSLAEMWGGKNNTFKVHLMSQPIGDFWLVYVVKRNLPYLDRFDVLQRRILEAGLEMRISKNNENSVWRNLHIKTNSPKNVTIRLVHLKSTILMCLSLICIAFMIFLKELYSGRKRIRKKKNKFSKFKNIQVGVLISTKTVEKNLCHQKPFKPFIQ